MNVKAIRKRLGSDKQLLMGGMLVVLLISYLLLYRLGTLPNGLSGNEAKAAAEAVGWHGIYHQFFYLPLTGLRSIIFFFFPDHGQLLSRLPNVIFGGLAVCGFAWLIYLWHGTRTALLAALLFGCSAWTLHVSRLVSFDVLYLWAMPTILLTQLLIKKYADYPVVWYGSLLIWGLMLYIPGLVWLVLLGFWLQRDGLKQGWQSFSSLSQRCISVTVFTIWLPLLILQLSRGDSWQVWLGLPAHMATGLELLKQFVAVPVHLLVRGPQYPELWLGKLPILDIFTLIICLLGIYFYIIRWRASRSRSLALYFLLGWILVGMGGSVSLSLLVPLLYLAAATGLTYLLHEWLRVFPRNPLARGLGTGLIVIAVAMSCLYNTRAYFVAWQHNPVTQATFDSHL